MKLAAKSGHLARVCTCSSCRNRNNLSRGKRGNSRAHRRLGGVGNMINDDLFHAYSVDLSVESKTGAQIPATIWKFMDLAWTRSAMGQANKKIPVGSGAYPAVYMERSPKHWVIVIEGEGDLRG